MNILDLLTRKLSHQLILPESIIHAVLNHQWKTARDATHTSNTIELTNLGTLMIRGKRLEREIKKYETLVKEYQRRLDNSTDEKEIVKNTKCLKNAEINLNFLLIKRDNL